MKDFFVSYTHSDQAWAEWIAWTLEEHGYTVAIQAWDFRTGNNFVLEMHKATGAERTLLVLSEDSLKAPFVQAEWAAAFAADPKGEKRRVFPVRVKPCEPPGLLRAINSIDLVGKGPEEAEQLLLESVADRGKPAVKPKFPGQAAASDGSRRVAPDPVPFPAEPMPFQHKRAVEVWKEKLGFLQEQEAILSDPAQKFAVRKQIGEARAKIRELGG
jgi:TIR domain